MPTLWTVLATTRIAQSHGNMRGWRAGS